MSRSKIDQDSKAKRLKAPCLETALGSMVAIADERVPKKRCAWVNADPLYLAYHDREWGKPIYDERLLFEFLNLEGMQAGLSWLTILKKRENYRNLFDHFSAEKIATYNRVKFNSLIKNQGIIRNKLKIEAIISNAKALLELKKSGENFVDYLWNFVGGKPILNQWKNSKDAPTKTPISDLMSKDLKKRGFKFVGSTICYAFMQAVGMVNDHSLDCFCRSKKLKKISKGVKIRQ